MTRLLVIKTSSMGDVVHGLVAAAVVRAHRPDLRLHWVVEEAFADVVRRSALVEHVHVLALRRWRQHLFRFNGLGETWREIRQAIRDLQSQTYDQLIDAQGLIKSAVVNRLAEVHGPRWGFDAQSARERPAAWAVDRGVSSPPADHAVRRLLTLFGQALDSKPVLDLAQDDAPLAYEPSLVFASDPNTRRLLRENADVARRLAPESGVRGLVLLAHGSSRAEKTWPVEQWQQLGRRISAAGFVPVFPSGHSEEFRRAQQLAQSCDGLALSPRSLAEMGEWLASAQVVVGVDSGLTHWAAAMGRPTVGLFLSTPISRFGLQWAARGISLDRALAQSDAVFDQMQAWLHQDTGALPCS
ncbi:MAG: lipopolysaccharide heptosyltransferase I [Burkholderiaceae bacterium]